jgi:hypothetical protein
MVASGYFLPLSTTSSPIGLTPGAGRDIRSFVCEESGERGVL